MARIRIVRTAKIHRSDTKSNGKKRITRIRIRKRRKA